MPQISNLLVSDSDSDSGLKLHQVLLHFHFPPDMCNFDGILLARVTWNHRLLNCNKNIHIIINSFGCFPLQATTKSATIPNNVDSKDENLIFVAGATGKVGSRTVRLTSTLLLCYSPRVGFIWFPLNFSVEDAACFIFSIINLMVFEYIIFHATNFVYFLIYRSNNSKESCIFSYMNQSNPPLLEKQMIIQQEAVLEIAKEL